MLNSKEICPVYQVPFDIYESHTFLIFNINVKISMCFLRVVR